MKLWQKETTSISEKIEKFTVGRDREMDLYLAPYDVQGNIAHAIMLESVGLLASDELKVLSGELKSIYQDIQQGWNIVDYLDHLIKNYVSYT